MKLIYANAVHFYPFKITPSPSGKCFFLAANVFTRSVVGSSIGKYTNKQTFDGPMYWGFLL